MDFTALSYVELKQARERINDRLRELEQAALATLQHRPLQHGWRLFKAAFGMRAGHTQEAKATSSACLTSAHRSSESWQIRAPSRARCASPT